jgi:hypothetical protein
MDPTGKVKSVLPTFFTGPCTKELLETPETLAPEAKVSKLDDVVVSTPDVRVNVPVNVGALPKIIPPLPFNVRLFILLENNEDGKV